MRTSRTAEQRAFIARLHAARQRAEARGDTEEEANLRQAADRAEAELKAMEGKAA